MRAGTLALPAVRGLLTRFADAQVNHALQRNTALRSNPGPLYAVARRSALLLWGAPLVAEAVLLVAAARYLRLLLRDTLVWLLRP
jgi:hypothetical protein